MKQIKGSIEVDNIKRCYVEAVIKVPCPICGSELKHDFNDNYLSYPVIGGDNETAYFYCTKCEGDENPCEFKIPIKVISADIVIEYDPSKIEPE